MFVWFITVCNALPCAICAVFALFCICLLKPNEGKKM